MVRFISIFTLLLAGACFSAVHGADSADLDATYVGLLNRIHSADALARGGDVAAARKAYGEVLQNLRAFQTQNPAWHPDVVGYRLRYVDERSQQPVPGTQGQGTNAVVQPPEPTEMDALKAHVLQLQQDRVVLEARLREALAGRPAALEPGEMDKAQKQIETQRLEIQRLHVALTQLRSAATNEPAGYSAEATAKLRSELEAGRRREAQWAERVSRLEKRVKELERTPANSSEPSREPPNVAATASPPNPEQPPLSVEDAVRAVAECLSRGDAQGAASALARVVNPPATNGAFLVAQARTALAKGRPDEAVRFAGAALRLPRPLPEAQHLLGRALMVQGADDAARAALDKALVQNPVNAEAHLDLAQLLGRRRPPDLALARWHYSRALQTGAKRDAALERTLGMSASPGTVAPLPASPSGKGRTNTPVKTTP